MNTNPFKIGQEVNWFDLEGVLHTTSVVEITQRTTLVADPGGGYREFKTKTLELFNLPVGCQVEVHNTLEFGEDVNSIAEVRSVRSSSSEIPNIDSISYDLRYYTIVGDSSDDLKVHLTGLKDGEAAYGGVMTFRKVLSWPEPPKKRPRKILGLVI